MKAHVTMLVLAAAFLSGCGRGVVSRAKEQHDEFIGAEPEAADVVGAYVLSAQTVVPGNMSALGGRQCELYILADGTFSITNYPQGSGTRFASLLSTTGTWQIVTVGTSYGYGPDPKDCWGFEFTGSRPRIDSTAFTGPKQPYGLLTVLGDPDSNRALRFKRKQHPTKPSTATD